MPIPNPNDPKASAAYVDAQGVVRVEGGMDAPNTKVGAVGFVVNMVMLWKGLAADKPKGWVIETAPAGSYLKIASADGEMGASGGSATAVDHVHTGAVHTHSHSHSLQSHTHSYTHDHGSISTGTEDHRFENVLQDGSGRDRDHDHSVDIPSHTGTTGTPSNNTTDSDLTTSSAANTGGVVTTPIALTPLFYGLYLIRYTGAP